VLCVRLDYEIKDELYSRIARAAKGEGRKPEAVREEVAERYHLKVVSGKIPIPDLRIEYVNENDNQIQHRDLELVYLQDRNPARARREESRTTRRDALEERLQGYRHHACANACDSEGPPLTPPLHTGPDLCRYGAPCFRDSGAALVGLVVE